MHSLNQIPEISGSKLVSSAGALEGEVVEELAMLAQEAYFPYNPLYMPNEWKIHNFETWRLGSFTGGFLRKIVDGKTVAWAVVFRGTVPTNVINLGQDIELLIGEIPNIIPLAEKYVTEQVKYLKGNPDIDLFASFETMPLYIVGHSLGATVASSIFTFVSIGNDKAGRIQCVTFDNPGSFHIVKKYIETKPELSDFSQEIMDGLVSWVYNIQSDVNVVNTCKEQWGKVYRMMRWGFAFSGMFGPRIFIPSSWEDNYHYIAQYSLYDQHQISSIVKSIKDNIPINLDQRKIDGLNSGYNAYLDPDTRKEYWTRYCSYCWENNIDLIRNKKKTLEEFTDQTFSHLRAIHLSEAKSTKFTNAQDVSNRTK